MNITKHLTPLLFTCLFLSCGNDSNKGGDKSTESRNVPQEEQIVFPADGSNIKGKYVARFTTLNPQVNGTVPGSVTFFRDKDRVMVYLRLFAGYPKAWHPQKIYEGTRCPTLEDDTNGDGYIDINEAEAVLGKILIPLDADISSQRSGRNFYPLGDLSGNYFYERVTSFSRMFRDLKDTKNASEEYKKLAPNEGFSIEGKAILVQGVGKDVEFPESVGSAPRYKPFQTLPVACGIFYEDNREPGVNDDGEIPGPIADIEPGQDRPAREGDGESERDDPSSNGSGRTNDADSGNTPTVDSDGRAPSDSNPRPPRDYGDDSSSNDRTDNNDDGGGRRWPWPWPGRGDSNDNGGSDNSSESSTDNSSDESSNDSSTPIPHTPSPTEETSSPEGFL